MGLELAPGQSEAFNIGAGQGRSVLQVLRAVERAVGVSVPYGVGGRRAGDPASLVADPARAFEALGWAPTRSNLDDIVRDALRWRLHPRYGATAIVPQIQEAAE